MIRFIHSSDIHLGKPFGGYPEDTRVRLRQARVGSLRTLAAKAKEYGASHILLAGDTFDQMTPTDKVVRQALNLMGEATHVDWVIMPGNHDHANAIELWRQILRDAPGNVAAVLEPRPFTLSNDAVLLPAPPTERNPGRDLTEWFDTASTGEAIRVGLAHGSITSFDSSEEGGSSVISPDRAKSAQLDYLGLGDWHGQLQVGPKTWYSGTPEAYSHKHSYQATALLVEIEAKNAEPKVTPVLTGTLNWQTNKLDVGGVEDIISLYNTILPAKSERENTLFALTITGRMGALERVAFETACNRTAPDFLAHSIDMSDLGVVHSTEDLDALDQKGALRSAAEVLAREAKDETLSPEARLIASTALSYLFTYALEE